MFLGAVSKERFELGVGAQPGEEICRVEAFGASLPREDGAGAVFIQVAQAQLGVVRDEAKASGIIAAAEGVEIVHDGTGAAHAVVERAVDVAGVEMVSM